MEIQDFVMQQFVTALEVIKNDRSLCQDYRLYEVFVDLADWFSVDLDND